MFPKTGQNPQKRLIFPKTIILEAFLGKFLGAYKPSKIKASGDLHTSQKRIPKNSAFGKLYVMGQTLLSCFRANLVSCFPITCDGIS